MWLKGNRTLFISQLKTTAYSNNLTQKKSHYDIIKYEQEQKEREKLMDNIWFFGYSSSGFQENPSRTYYSKGNKSFQKFPDIKISQKKGEPKKLFKIRARSQYKTVAKVDSSHQLSLPPSTKQSTHISKPKNTRFDKQTTLPKGISINGTHQYEPVDKSPVVKTHTIKVTSNAWESARNLLFSPPLLIFTITKKLH